jgi:putative NADH-flavin reductase
MDQQSAGGSMKAAVLFIAHGASTTTDSVIAIEDVRRTECESASYISLEDYAVAMLDELEHPTHPRQRFTAGY